MGPNAKLTRAFPSLCSYTDLQTHQKDCVSFLLQAEKTSLAQKVWDTRSGVGNKGWKRSRMRGWIVFFCHGIKFSKREKGICSTIPVFLGLPWSLSQTYRQLLYDLWETHARMCACTHVHTRARARARTHTHTHTHTLVTGWPPLV